MRAWWRRLTTPPSRTRGLPASSNRASSFHLWWVPDPPPLRSVAAVLVVSRPPRVPRLYFWALQVSFLDRGAPVGGAHTGLQWNPRFPGSTAVNWGGYTRQGTLLEGTPSPLPSTPGDPNTRDLSWEPGRPYRLEVAPADRPGWWRATVSDLSTGRSWVVRDLAGSGSALGSPVVWSEVFARCDDPTVEVRWSGLEAVDTGGGGWRPSGVRVGYQAVSRGGCSNTSVEVDGDAVVQRTATSREIPDGAHLALG